MVVAPSECNQSLEEWPARQAGAPSPLLCFTKLGLNPTRGTGNAAMAGPRCAYSQPLAGSRSRCPLLLCQKGRNLLQGRPARRSRPRQAGTVRGRAGQAGAAHSWVWPQSFPPGRTTRPPRSRSQWARTLQTKPSSSTAVTREGLGCGRGRVKRQSVPGGRREVGHAHACTCGRRGLARRQKRMGLLG